MEAETTPGEECRRTARVNQGRSCCPIADGQKASLQQGEYYRWYANGRGKYSRKAEPESFTFGGPGGIGRKYSTLPSFSRSPQQRDARQR